MFRQQFDDRSHTVPSALPRVPVLRDDTDTDPAALLSELVNSRVEDYLDQVMAPLIGALPYARRQEMRRELRQHIQAMIAAYQEMGEVPEAACAKAFDQFGKPDEVSASIRRSNIDQNHWSRVRTWWKQPRLSAVGLVPFLLLTGMAFGGYFGRSHAPTKTATASIKPTQIRVMVAGLPFHHADFIKHPCTSCHRDGAFLAATGQQVETRIAVLQAEHAVLEGRAAQLQAQQAEATSLEAQLQQITAQRKLSQQ